jgi:hypothetical protein
MRVAAGASFALPLGALLAHAQVPKAFENASHRYSVSLPAGCRHDVGPGTLDAVCSPGFDEEQSASASAAGSLVLEVGAERVADSAGKSSADLAQLYGEAAFKEELPQAVCGEADASRVKISNLHKVLEETRVVYTADIACPEIKFLALGERRAAARFLITPGMRYRLMARAPSEDFEERKETIDAFFASFRVLPAEQKVQ